eukprot:GHVQ01023213.1.p2 GENE.GHVQ01023213.1~~GHVQ01023213.1.p2  ORF type:complete len:338 (+),score=36.07 GHVQ01023213.1:100-1014(+)
MSDSSFQQIPEVGAVNSRVEVPVAHSKTTDGQTSDEIIKSVHELRRTMVAIGNTKTGRVVDEANSTSKPSDTITKRTRDTEKGQTIRRVTRRRIRPEDIAYSRRNEEADVPKCQHLVVIHGMCVNCCEAVSEDTTIHAPGFISNEIGLRMNKQYAADLERRELESLLTSRKLCLILDLDNTLLHASGVPVPQDLGVQVIELPCGEEHPWYFVENKCQSCSQHDTEHSSCRRDQCLCEFRRTQYGDINNDSTKSAMKALESCVVKAVLRGGSCTGGGKSVSPQHLYAPTSLYACSAFCVCAYTDV